MYLLLDPSVRTDRSLTDVLKEAAEGGVRLFQYRDKQATMKDAYARAMALRKAAADLDALLIVNDRCDLAMAVDADGVHLGQDDLPYEQARRLLGPDKLIGISTHNAEQVKEAERLKPDYIGFGPIFTPGSKKDHDPVVGIEGLAGIRPLTSRPIFAIGGIQLDRVRSVMQSGANGIAVVSAILSAADVKRAVRDFIAQLP